MPPERCGHEAGRWVDVTAFGMPPASEWIRSCCGGLRTPAGVFEQPPIAVYATGVEPGVAQVGRWRRLRASGVRRRA
jgi:hypothetical protein